MPFLFFLIISILLLYLSGRIRKEEQFVPILIFIVNWVLFVGGQYDVGTDYVSYLEKFSDLEAAKVAFSKEYVFLSIITFSKNLWNNPQVTLFLLSFISIIFFLLFLEKSLEKRDWWIYFFLFVTFSTAFNNHFNAIRQYLAIFIQSLAFITLLRKNPLPALLLFAVGVGVHKSAILFVGIAFLIYYLSNLRISNRIFYLILLLSGLIPLLSYSFYDQMISLLIERTVAAGLGYERYLQGKVEYIESLSSVNIYSKLIFLPFYFATIYLRDRLVFNKFESKLLSAGVFFFAIKLLCLLSSITNRFGMYVELLMVFPLAFLFRYLYMKKPMVAILSFSFFFLFYILKVIIFPEGEYIYNSVFF